LGFLGGVLFDSFFEWALHRNVMHRRVKLFPYPFDTHALTHHKIFKADDTYHLQSPRDKHTVRMAWWNGPVLIIITQIPFLILGWIISNAALVLGSFIASCLYYAAYEYLHWCMHVPRARSVERSGLFFRLNGHHLLHHRYMGKNLNVVLPLADWCLGTLLVRSPIRFAQARGTAVPDVQPWRDPNKDSKVFRFFRRA
ncbi:MAG: sterol desaturase family protein, partial [Limisphaerales bacterium]